MQWKWALNRCSMGNRSRISCWNHPVVHGGQLLEAEVSQRFGPFAKGDGSAKLTSLVCVSLCRRIMSAWKKHTQNNPNELPYHNNQNSGDYNNNNNTAYPQANNYGNYNTQQYAAPTSAYPIKEPQQAYTPSMAGAYGNNGTYQYGQNTNTTNTDNNGMSTHDYEYRQAEENRLREEAEARQGSGNAEPAPPGYDSATRPGEPARSKSKSMTPG